MSQLLKLLLILQFLLPNSYGQSTSVVMTIDKDKLIFGETLNIQIKVVTFEPMMNVTLDLFLPEGLDFTAMINRTECEGRRNCLTSPTEEVKANENLISRKPFNLEKISVPAAKVINLVPDTEWNTNFTYIANIEVTNIGTNDVQQQEFVSSILKYFDRHDTPGQSATIKYANHYYTLVPVKIRLNIGSADVSSSTVNVYLTSSTNVSVEAEVDPRGLPILIQLQLPTDMKLTKAQKPQEFCEGYKYNGEGINCTTTDPPAPVAQKLIKLSRRTAVLDKGFPGNNLNDLPLNESVMNDTLPILLKREDSPERFCLKTCKVTLTLAVEMNDKVAAIGDLLTFGAKVFFGQNLNLSISTESKKVGVVGPDLQVEIVPDKDKDIEAGEEIKYSVSLRHSDVSTDDVIINYYSITVHNDTGMQLKTGTVTATLNRGTTDSLPDTVLATGFQISSLAKTDVYVVNFVVQMTDETRIDTEIPVEARLIFGYKSAVQQNCNTGPCKHGGTCVTGTNGNKNCECTEHFTGSDCGTRKCGVGFQSSNTTDAEHCYILYTTPATFSDAQQECAKRGGYLPSIHSQQELKILTNFWDPVAQPSRPQKLWIGLSRIKTPFRWDDQTIYDYKNWADFEPTARSDCAILSTEKAYSWSTKNCSEKFGYVCQDALSDQEKGLTKIVSRTIHTKRINFNKVALNLPNKLRIHQPVDIVMDMGIPLGTIKDMVLETTIQSNDLTDIKETIRFVHSMITSPSSIQFGQKTQKELNATQFTVEVSDFYSRKRRKRATMRTIILRVPRLVGDIYNRVNGGQSGSLVNFVTTFLADTRDPSVAGSVFSVTTILKFNGNEYTLVDPATSSIAIPALDMTRTIQKVKDNMGRGLVVTTIAHEPNSTGSAEAIVYSDDVSDLMVATVPVGAQMDGKIMKFMKDSLDVGETLQFSYEIFADASLPNTTTYRSHSLKYSSIGPSEDIFSDFPSIVYGPISVSVCYDRMNDLKVDVRYHNHGFSFLVFILAFLAAAVLLFLIFYCVYKRGTKRPKSGTTSHTSVPEPDRPDTPPNPTGYVAMEEELLIEPERKVDLLIIQTMTEQCGQDSTIIPALIEPSQQDMFRHLDRMDIVDNAKVEKEMNKEQLDTLINAQNSSIEAMAVVGRITKPEANLFIDQMKKRINESFKQIDKDYQKELDNLGQKLGVKNRTEVDNLLAKQAVERTEISTETNDLPQAEKEEILRVLTEQQKVEMNTLLYKLQLDQEEQLLKLQKEFNAKKEALLGEIQAQLAKDLDADGKLDTESAELIMAEIDRIRRENINFYDAERARQRALMSVKFQTRRNLARLKELFDNQKSDLLNSMVLQMFESIDKLVGGILSASDGQKLKDSIKEEVEALRIWMDKEQNKREQNLRKTLETEKKQKLAELKNKQARELLELDKQLSSEKDPTKKSDKLIKQRQSLLSDQRRDLSHLENELDEIASRQLQKLHADLIVEAKDKFCQQTEMMFKRNGVPADEVAQMLKQLNGDVDKLEKQQEIERQKQANKLQDKLKQRKKDLEEEVEVEIEEQKELRDHEENVLRNILTQQATLSDTERDALLKAQKEHLANMEHSLALSKVKQKQILEKKLFDRRQMLKSHLDKKFYQQNGSKTSLGSSGAKEFVNERLKITQQPNLDVDSEIRKIQEEMLVKRAESLKSQEDRLGALVAQLQVDKAREMSTIEQQEEALYGLTTCMVDDMTDRGVLTTADCQKVIERHQQEQEILTEKLDGLKSRQDAALRQKLAERKQIKQKSMERHQSRELHAAVNQPEATSVAVKIDVLNVVTKQLLEEERSKIDVEREAQQVAEDQRRKFEIEKRKSLQEQELNFVNDLVKMGNFKKAEISGVLRLVFPQKRKREVKEMVTKLFTDCPENNNEDDNGDSTKLEDRILASDKAKLVLDRRSNGRSKRKRQRNAANLLGNEFQHIDGQVVKLPPIQEMGETTLSGATLDEFTAYLKPKKPNLQAIHHT